MARSTKSATTTRKTSTRKTTSTKTPAKTTTKAASAPEAPTPVVTEAPAPVVTGPMMRKKELIEAVVSRSGIKKKDAKPVVEAMLDVLGDALADGRELNLQPLGKVMVKKSKDLPAGKVLITRIRQSKPAAQTPAPDAAPSEAAE
ncbi:MAG: HU family DNA-binding protein [Pseudomonadota bacterium]